MIKKDYYFLFGHDISVMMWEGNIKGVISAIKKGYDYQLCHYSAFNFEPIDILYDYDGWDGYVELKDYQYEQIKAAINE